MELRVLRLQFWQGVLACEGDVHAQVLAAVFGELKFERNLHFMVDGAMRENTNPWAKRLLDDVQALKHIDDFTEFADSVGDCIFKLLQPGPLRDAFPMFDFRILRLFELRKRAPPWIRGLGV